MTPQHKGILSIFISCFLFSLMTIIAREASLVFSGPFIAFTRFIVGALGSIVCILLFRQSWKIEDKVSWLLRGLFGGISMSLFFIAIQLTSGSRASLLANTYPIFAVLSGALFFKEPIKKQYILGLLFCSIGIYFVFFDRNTYSLWGNLAGLGAGITGGIAIHYIRRVSHKSSIFFVYLSACLFGLLFTSFTASEARLLVPGLPLVALLAVALLAWAGQLLMANGYKTVTVARGSMMGYAETLLTLVLSNLLIGEEIKPRFVWGFLLILSGLVLSQWQRRFDLSLYHNRLDRFIFYFKSLRGALLRGVLWPIRVFGRRSNR